ncbi:TetR family transcriptional regulator C-terminal domain-containing protein [Robiginitalea sp. M366]|uniref:TetR/AcrR family transcriptional regulator n=1 Tax=Robiginitalea aestuariiviva TaxID=3036903 RepID=UPI00240CF084|nr:TetR family transcriptional regulator C-terminal domain-containing protein [Robiginitalea aestuariiviva]MDG1573198.1 TetR family transcriptional regulator C-terminal domain-containing protein [Robiginitalea aestuariiviva]
MATQTKKKQNTAAEIVSAYMTQCLEEGQAPASVYKFSKSLGIEEAEFYQHFGSLDAVRKGVWQAFFDQTRTRIETDKAFEDYSAREKWLSFYYTFFELLTLNRSYVTFTLGTSGKPLEQLEQLAGLRALVRDYALETLEAEAPGDGPVKLRKRRIQLVSEGIWVQTLMLLRFWMRDESPGFQKTDMAIEKSVQTAFDLVDTAPVERLLDFGKFLLREHFGKPAGSL